MLPRLADGRHGGPDDRVLTMSPSTYTWLTAAHVISLFLWIGGLFAIYWLLRLHAHAPKEMHEKLTLMQRSIAMSADIASAVAIGTGVAMIVGHPLGMLLAQKGQSWLHIKLTVVVLGVLPVHGMLRAKIKKFSRGNIIDVPTWLWSLFIAAVTAAVILVFHPYKY